MKRSIRRTGAVAIIAAAAVLATAPGVAGADTKSRWAPPARGTIVDAAVATPSLSILVQAVQKAGLVETLADPKANFTVYAPTNDAFVKLLGDLGLTSLDQVPVPTLKAILLDHVVAGATPSFFLRFFDWFDYDQTALGGLKIEADRAPLGVNDAGISIPDVRTSNGIVHVIDKVLLDPDPRPTIAELAIATPSLSILVQAAIKADLVGTLSDRSANLTVFAPTNDAFAKLLGDLGLTSLDQVPVPTLKAILLDHVVGQELDAVDVLDRARFGFRTTALGDLRLRFRTGPLRVNNANIVATDIEANNGTVHVIDTVLLQPAGH